MQMKLKQRENFPFSIFNLHKILIKSNIEKQNRAPFWITLSIIVKKVNQTMQKFLILVFLNLKFAIMIKKAQSTIFKFILTHDQLFSNLDHLKLNDYDRFIKIGHIGKQIQQLAKQNDAKALEKICDDNFFNLQLMQLQIIDAFVSALHLRNEQVVHYFLKNGIQLDSVEPGCILELCYSLQYLKHDPPIELLQILLQYGGNSRFADNLNSDTSLHVASKYGNIEFMKLLIEYGADINGVNDQKMTPLGCAISGKHSKAIDLLKSKNASEKWNS